MTAPLTITVRYFASIREAVGQGQETLRTAAPPWARCATS